MYIFTEHSKYSCLFLLFGKLPLLTSINPFNAVTQFISARIGPRSPIFKTDFSLSYRLHLKQTNVPKAL